MASNKLINLTCLVFSTDIAQGDKLVDTIRRHEQVAHINQASSPASLRNLLAESAHDFMLVVLENSHDCLPACLLRYPEMQVMVVTSARKAGDVDVWLQQGANEVVSYQRHDRLRFALKRMIDECTLRRKLSKATRQLASQDQLQRLLLNSHTEALMLWQNGTILKSNPCFSALIGSTEQDKLTEAQSWSDWISADSYRQLHDDNPAEPIEAFIVNRAGRQYRAHREMLILEGGPAQLVRIDPKPVHQHWLEEQTDSVTGLLLRERFLLQLEQWLQDDNEHERYTATQIVFAATTADPTRSDTTLHELLIYRAVNLLEQFLGRQTLMARLDDNTLVVAGPAEFAESRKAACRVKQCIGNLGGLLENEDAVRVSTLTLSAKSLSARQVLERLNRKHGCRHGSKHGQASERKRPLRSSSDDCASSGLSLDVHGIDVLETTR